MVQIDFCLLLRQSTRLGKQLASRLQITGLQFELAHDKTNKLIHAPSKDSDQPGNLPSLISLRCPHEETLDH